MDVVLLLLKEVQALRSELKDLRAEVAGSKIRINGDSIYTNKELQQILGVDSRLIKKYRDIGLLSYHRQEDKYWYMGQDVMEFLAQARYSATA